MFEKPRQLDAAFRYVRGFSFALLAVSGITGIYAIRETVRVQQETSRRIYLLANDKVLEAVAANRRENLAVEARDHIKTFHEFFFTLEPDEKLIRTHVTRALYLADASAKKEYDNLKEKGYFTSLVSGTISQQLVIDSISLDLHHLPYAFRCQATERLIRASSVLTRSLLTTGFLRPVERSENNPHGFIIEQWQVLENKDIKTETR